MVDPRWPNVEIDPKGPMGRFLALSQEERAVCCKRAKETRPRNPLHQVHGKNGREVRRQREAA